MWKFALKDIHVFEREPPLWLKEWKRRGIVISNTDAIVQAFRIFNEKIVDQNLKSRKLSEEYV